MKFKWIGTWSAVERKARLFRLMWERGTVGDGKGYSAKLTLALRPSLFAIRREWQSVAVTLLGVQVHLKRSFGGRFV